MATTYFNTVSVLLGNGDGSFLPKADYAAGCGQASLAIGDLDGSGTPDLVVGSNDGCTKISVLLGNGDGTFGPKTDYEAEINPAVAIADLDKDGRPDLVAANGNGNTVSILLGNGNGSFSPRTNYPTGVGPSSVAVQDFNGDGTPDVVTASRLLHTVSVLPGNGNGTFGPKSDYGVGATPAYAVAIGDLNGDGRPDLAIANSGVTVLLNIHQAPNRAPNCANAHAIPAELWPPNHRMVPISLAGIVDPDGDAVTITATRVTQDEPLDGHENDEDDADAVSVAAPGGSAALGHHDAPGGGRDREARRCPDAVIDAQGRVALRAERAGKGDGRVYTIWFTAHDERGESCDGSVQVCVPHDRRHSACVAHGQDFNSLGPCPGGHGHDHNAAQISLGVAAGAGSLTLEYSLLAASDVSIEVYDIAGRRVATVERGMRDAGDHAASWDARGVSRGMYFYRLRAGSATVTRSVLVLK